MSPMPEPKGPGATTAPTQDDDASSAYSGSSYFSEDEHTLPGDALDNNDARSTSSASSYESYDSFSPREQLPSYRVPRSQGPSQPVYEAWVLCMSEGADHEVTRLSSCGVDILSARDEERPYVVTRTELHDQAELGEMALAAVGNYAAANKRGFAARLFRGKAKTYEQDLDERLRRLPPTLQSNLNELLRNREDATSNRFRRRDWTVALMREQYRYRFASAAPEEVRKKKGGLFKGKDTRRVEYFFVLKGAEGKVAAGDKVMHQPREFDNPWKRVDEEERVLREQAREIKKHGKGYLGEEWCPSPRRRRSLSPPYNPPPRSRFQDSRTPRQPPFPVMVDITERGRPSSRSRSRTRSRSRSPYTYRSPAYSPVRNACGRGPLLNPFVPMGGLPPLPPTPTAYYAPTPGPCYAPAPGRFMAPPPFPPPPAGGHHHPAPFGLPPFDPYMRHGPSSTWQPLGMGAPTHAYADVDAEPDQFPIPIVSMPSTMHPPPPPPPAQQHMAPYPLEISSPPDSPRTVPASAYNCLGGCAPPPPPMMMPPPPPPGGFPTMEACHALFDAEFPDDDEDEDGSDDEGSDGGSSVRSSPPPAPKPSNLTTPTEFSPAASSHHTGSSVQSGSSTTDGAGVAGVTRVELF